MAVAHDATSVAVRGTGNLSWTHTPVGTPRGVCVLIVQDGPVTGGAATDEVSGVTYGGVAMTRQKMQQITANATNISGTVYIYSLHTSIPTGAQTVAVTVTGAQSKIAVAATQTASADTAADTSVSGNNGAATVTNPTLTLATTASTTTVCYAACHASIAAASITENSSTLGATLISETAGTGANDTANIFRGTSLGAGGNVLMGWTFNNDWWAGAAIAIKEASASFIPRSNVAVIQAIKRASTF